MRIAKPSILYAVLLLVFIIAGCKQNKKESQSEMETVKTESEQNPIEETVFGEMPDGTKVKKFTLKNEAGMCPRVTLTVQLEKLDFQAST